MTSTAYRNDLAALFAPPSCNDSIGSSASSLEHIERHNEGHFPHPDFHASIDDRILGNNITKRCGGPEHKLSFTGRESRRSNEKQRSRLINPVPYTHASSHSSLSLSGTAHNICWVAA